MRHADSPAGPTRAHEARLAAEAGGPVCGIDEAGRGPWAGPVVAAAVILDPAAIPAGLDDSKKLGAVARARLRAEIVASARVGVGIAGREEIDALNILRATLLAMTRAVAALGAPPAAALVDGNVLPALPCPARALVGGDGLSLSVAAASIVAKATRDAHMRELAGECPGYGWERNMGYGTAEHRAGLVRLGVSRHHRLSFRPVREIAAADGGERNRGT